MKCVFDRAVQVLPGLFIFAHLAVSSLYAQGLESPKEFYEPGYVNQPGEHSLSSNAESASRSSGSSSSVVTSSEPSEASETSSTESEVSGVYAEGEGEKPVGLSLLVSTSDPEAAKKRALELVTFASKTGISLRDLYLVGDPQRLAGSGFFAALSAQKSSFITRFVPAVPKEFGKIQRSPALLVETKTGLVVVEAYPRLAQIFTKDGRFIEPSAAIDQNRQE